jgi:hypothetical protein
MDAENANCAPKTTHTALAIGLAMLAGILRLVPHPWSIAPMGAIGLFAGARMRGWTAFAVPVGVRVVTDLLLSRMYEGFPLFYPFECAAYVLCVLIGRTLVRTTSPLRIGGAALSGGVVFFLVSNFGSWLQLPELYARTPAGLAQAFLAGIEFYRDHSQFGIMGVFVGDLIYTPALFGAHALVAWLLDRREAARIEPESDAKS